METVKILLITVLPAIVLACIVGVLFGRHQVKKANHQLRSLLNLRERIVYSVSVAAGVGCVLLGIFLPAPAPEDMVMNDMGMMDGGAMLDDGMGKDFNPDLPGGEGNAADLPIDAELFAADTLEGEETTEDTEAVEGDAVNGETEETEPAPATNEAAIAVSPPIRRAAPDVAVAIMR